MLSVRHGRGWNHARTTGALAFLLSLAGFSCAGVPQRQQVSEIVETAAAAEPQTGQELYIAYCASCHGANGNGNGPVARSLRTPPTDLTRLAAENHGAFPEKRVYDAATGESSTSAHGSKDMPVWGPAFMKAQAPNQAELERRLKALVGYIKTLQA